MGFLDKIIRFFEENTKSREVLEPGPVGFPDFVAQFFNFVENLTPSIEQTFDTTQQEDFKEAASLTRKFVAGLVYCGGKKRTAYALTFEESSDDREFELLEAIESETSDICSEIRANFGYSEEPGFSLDSSPEYPGIEVGFE